VSADVHTPIITLTTDFGLSDYFVGVLKGVLLQALPEVRIVDISHEIPRHDIISGAFVINEIFPYFPPGAVHLAVVDPGVGSTRRNIVVDYGGQHFVAPDNGLLSYVLGKAESRVYKINLRVGLKFKASPTFAGRDHFAPIAAMLASGRDPSELGEEIDDPCRLPGLSLGKRASGVIGKIVYFDHFGNGITNIKASDLSAASEVIVAGLRLGKLKQNYDEGSGTEGNIIINSSERLEVFVRGDSAKGKLNLKLMEVVTVHPLQ
jgi:S-adenosyl-L-methionine hydrolase (adenosine-forming)